MFLCIAFSVPVCSYLYPCFYVHVHVFKTRWVTQVVHGWDIAISKMSKGTRGRFVLPPELAYGQWLYCRRVRVCVCVSPKFVGAVCVFACIYW